MDHRNQAPHTSAADLSESGTEGEETSPVLFRTAPDVLGALLYAAQVAETNGDQVHQWARTYSSEPYDLLAARVSGEAEDPDARTACDQLLTVYQGMPAESRDAVMVQVASALKGSR